MTKKHASLFKHITNFNTNYWIYLTIFLKIINDLKFLVKGFQAALLPVASLLVSSSHDHLLIKFLCMCLSMHARAFYVE